MQYEIKALRGKDGFVTFTLDAAGADDALSHAAGQGYTVVWIKSKASWPLWPKPGKPGFPVVLFSQELLSLLEAGLSLVEALATLAEKEHRTDIRTTLEKINAALREGHTLSYALEKSGADFPQLYIETIRASEKTGALSEVLMRYIGYQKKMDSVRGQMISAAIYPALVTAIGGAVMLFLMLYVVPRFSRIYAEINTNLPLMSQLLMQWGQFLANHGWQVMVIIFCLLGALIYALIHPSSKQWLKQRLWQIPAIGVRLRIYQLARFYRSLGMLLRGGMPIVPALQMVAGQLDISLRAQLAEATESVRKGWSISQAMEQYELTTPVALSMIRVGERTGQMGEMMERIAAFHEEETARWLERFIKMFEPLLMTGVGLVIGIVVVLMYFPIFELAGSIQ